MNAGILLLHLLEVLPEISKLPLLLLQMLCIFTVVLRQLLDLCVVLGDDQIHIGLVTLRLSDLIHLLVPRLSLELFVGLHEGIDSLLQLVPFSFERLLVCLHGILVLVPERIHLVRLGVLHVDEVCFELREDLVSMGLRSLTFATDGSQVGVQLLTPCTRLGFAALVMLQQLLTALLFLDRSTQAFQSKLLHVRKRLQELDHRCRPGLAVLKVSELLNYARHRFHLPAELQGVLLQKLHILSHLLGIFVVVVASLSIAGHHIEVFQPQLLGEALHELWPQDLDGGGAVLPLQTSKHLRRHEGKKCKLLFEFVHDGEDALGIDICRLRSRHGVSQ
mmetsp:Transcript_16975/g.40237  ORF Transcript_16975/g.40237 Transcript_16975/m.40237 type:complete len:334 (-) Transcript_16975:16-1017(-)